MSKEFVIKISDLEKIVLETCDLIQKNNNEFPISEDDIQEIFGDDEKAFLEDETEAYNVFVSIYNELDEEDQELYTQEVQEIFHGFDEFVGSMEDGDEIEDLLIFDLKKEDGKNKKSNKSTDKKEDKKANKNQDKKSNKNEISYEDLLDFFLDVQEKVENEDVIIDESLVIEKPTKSNIVESIQDIFKSLDDEDVDELSEKSQKLFKKLNNKDFQLSDYKAEDTGSESDESDDNKSTKKDDKKTDKKKDSSKSTKKQNKKSNKEDVDETNEEKEDAVKESDNTKDKEVKENKSRQETETSKQIPVDANKKCNCGEKTIILKGSPDILDKVIQLFDAIGDISK